MIHLLNFEGHLLIQIDPSHQRKVPNEIQYIPGYQYNPDSLNGLLASASPNQKYSQQCVENGDEDEEKSVIVKRNDAEKDKLE